MPLVVNNSYVRHSVAKRSGDNANAVRMMWGDYDYSLRFPTPKRGAKGQGVRFERKVHDVLLSRYPTYVSAMPIGFYSDGRKQVAIPDGLLYTPAGTVIVEIKLRHCMEAWFQLRRLYGPLVEKALPGKVKLLEICQHYEPEVKFPEQFQVVTSIEQFFAGEANIGVWLWGR